jgi:hypothetical protein
MSGFSSIAIPGRIPVSGSGRGAITPDSLFGSASEKAAYQRIIDAAAGGKKAESIKVKNVCVRIFDLSNSRQVKEYEKLWAELIEKASRMEVIVDHHKDLVQRKDGTSYWMKYVEYVEFGAESEDDVKNKNGVD